MMRVSCLYIHIPFCVRKCLYCDFFSIPYDDSAIRTYADALCKELALKKHLGGILKTAYFGGGTPTLLPVDCFGKLFRCIRDNYRLSTDIEITVEANPGTIGDAKIEALISLGVNRLSIGVQSFSDNELSTLGRIHSGAEAVKSVEALRKAGLRNFSIDLMYGIPGQTMESWKESLSRAIDLSPAHISAYELTPEKTTKLYTLIASRRISMLDEELILEMYNHAIDYLASHDYEHYEISNYALSGFKCRHNLNYWNRGEYIGAGPGAHSFVGGTRSRNVKDLKGYIDYLDKGVIPETEQTNVSREEALREFIFLGLRKTEGISIKKAEEQGLDILAAGGQMLHDDYVETKDDRLRLTRKGIAVSNLVIADLLEKAGL